MSRELKGKKSICHVTSVHHRYDVRILDKECVSLSESGYEVTLLVNDDLDSEIYNGVNVTTVGRITKNRVMRILFAKRKFFQIAKSVDAIIYHFHDPELLPLGKRLKKSGKIVIYDSHEDVPRQLLAKTWIPRWMRKPISFVYEKYENRIVRSLDAVVVPTPHIRDRFINYNINTTIVANYPLKQEFSETLVPVEKKEQACYVGGITRQRGIMQIAEATHRANMKLVLCGRFESDILKEELLNRYSHIEYLGIVDRNVISEVIRSSILGFVTLLYTPNHYYSYPIKMFEYMAGGIPVIASDFPLWKTLVEDNQCGICVNPERIEEIVSAIDFISAHSDKANQMGERGREKVLTEYNWEAASQKLIDLYQLLKSSYL